MLSGEGNARERRKTTTSLIIKKSNFARAAHFFCTFLCRCFARLLTTMNFQKLLSYTFYGGNVERVLVPFYLHCPCSFSPCIGDRYHFLFCHHCYKMFMLFFQQKMSPLFFISRSRSLSPFFSLSFAGLLPTLSFSLSFSCSIFQICGHDNYSKRSTLDKTDTETTYRFPLSSLLTL